MDEFFDSFNAQRDRKNLIDRVTSAPTNYVGCKKRLLPYIYDVLKEEKIRFDSVLDAFSGSAIVSLFFKEMGKKVYSNDLLSSSTMTSKCLLATDAPSRNIPLMPDDLRFLYENVPDDCDAFVLNNYKDKFFTESECKFLDRYKKNMEKICGSKICWGYELINKAMLLSIPNSNFSIYGKNLKSLRSTHDVEKSFWDEKWRDTTRKRRNANNEIMFGKVLVEIYQKYQKALKGMDAKITNRCYVFNNDIIELLEKNNEVSKADLVYLDPPYGNTSSDYTILYRFLEEYICGAFLGDIEHIQKGAKRFNKNKGYQEQFEKLLSFCGGFKTWLISYNESSYADIDVIVSTIKNAGKKTVKVIDIPITYKHRTGRGIVDPDWESYSETGKKHLERGTEYLILAS